VKVDNSSIERVEDFKYLGTMLTDQNSIPEEIKSRLKLGNACCHSVQNLLSSRLLSNEELENAIGYENIVRHIKSKRLSWLGHVERMPKERVAKTIYKWKPYVTIPKGRPRLR
jgi:hypothetical protein